MLRVLVLFVSLTASACGTEFRPPSTEEPREATLAAIQNDIFATSCTFGSCHGDEAPAAELDLRAHDVCAALVGHSSPLWGVATSPPYMHDGRSPTLRDAILAHGGEAVTSRGAFQLLAPDDQQAVLDFMATLGR